MKSVTRLPTRELVEPAPISDFRDILTGVRGYVEDRFNGSNTYGEPSEIYIDGEPAELCFD